MELSLKTPADSLFITFPPQTVCEANKEAFIDQALEIHSLISLELANCTNIKKSVRQQALSLIERLDSILESLENIQQWYGYYYQVLIEILEICNLDKKVAHLIRNRLEVALATN